MKEQLYCITKATVNLDEGHLEHQINLNVNHSVFEGHFPDQPVLPGVCQIEIITQLLESTMDKTLTLVKSKNIKFLKMIDPHVINELTIDTKVIANEGDIIKISSNIQSHEGVCLKLKAEYKPF